MTGTGPTSTMVNLVSAYAYAALTMVLFLVAINGMEYDTDYTYPDEVFESLVESESEVDGDEPLFDEPEPYVRDRWERRTGSGVEGGYTVHEPDGTVHHVTYAKTNGQPVHY